MTVYAGDNNGEILKWVDTGGFWFTILTDGGYLPSFQQKNVFYCPLNKTSAFTAVVNSATYTMSYAINSVDRGFSYDKKYGPSYCVSFSTSGGTTTYTPYKMMALESPSQTIGICDGSSWLVRSTNGKQVGVGVHSGAMNASFWDGHVELIPESTLTKSGGFSVPVLPSEDMLFSVTKKKG